MTPEILALLNECIRTGNMLPFYKLRQWVHLRKQVLQMDRHECQYCKKRGYHRKARYVHHVNQLRDRPELALSIHYTDTDGNTGRNLISLCFDCHEREHQYRIRQPAPPLTPERW